MKINYEKLLNSEQLEVVENGEGYCLVLSGPGSGKTRTLTFRVAYLLEKGIDPERILLLTFTKKAAKEMLRRIRGLVGHEADRVLGGTFHHVGNFYLRKYSDLLGYERHYTILDQEDSKNVIQLAIEEMEEVKSLPKAKSIQKFISLAVNSNKSLSETIDDEKIPANKLDYLEEVKRIYEKRKKEKNMMDYDDLLINWLKLLKKSDLKDEIADRFKYILVDEYQDTNVIQDKILGKLSSKHENLMVVGDDSQSIYSFRAAEIKNILNFTEKYPAKIFKLETNYRSTPEILKLANCIIKNNNSKLNKSLKSVKKEGAKPVIACLTSPREQSRFIVRTLEEKKISESAVLFRAHYHAAGLELELAKEGIPYVVRGGTRFFEKAHIKDVSSFLKLLINPKDESSWIRVLKMQEGIGDAYAQRMTKKVTLQPEITFKNKDFGDQFPEKVATGIEEILNLIEAIKKIDEPEKKIEYFLENWYFEKAEEGFDNPEERKEDLTQLISLSKEYDDLESMLSDFALNEDFEVSESNFQGALTLSTIHQAKGLEWKNVFIIGLKEGKFPHKKALDEDLIEEERRLFYVAVTRCKTDLYLTYPLFEKNGSTNPSRFLREVEDYSIEEWESDDEEEIELIDEDDFDFF